MLFEANLTTLLDIAQVVQNIFAVSRIAAALPSWSGPVLSKSSGTKVAPPIPPKKWAEVPTSAYKTTDQIQQEHQQRVSSGVCAQCGVNKISPYSDKLCDACIARVQYEGIVVPFGIELAHFI
jgi:hypothetical protein